MTQAESFLSPTETQQVVQAIYEAEQLTSAEIKVHLESYSDTPPLIKACEVFRELNMHQTAARNGILIYICIQTKKFALYADVGVSDRVDQLFWEAEKDTLIHHFQHQQYAQGLCKVIADIAQKISVYFPYQAGDINELTNDISVN